VAFGPICTPANVDVQEQKVMFLVPVHHKLDIWMEKTPPDVDVQEQEVFSPHSIIN